MLAYAEDVLNRKIKHMTSFDPEWNISWGVLSGQQGEKKKRRMRGVVGGERDREQCGSQQLEDARYNSQQAQCSYFILTPAHKIIHQAKNGSGQLSNLVDKKQRSRHVRYENEGDCGNFCIYMALLIEFDIPHTEIDKAVPSSLSFINPSEVMN